MLFASFEKVIILDWHDKIINGFIKIDSDFYYFNLLFEDKNKYDYIYVCLSVAFFVESKKIIQIIQTNSFKQNENQLNVLLNRVKQRNKSYLIKTEDLRFGSREIVAYKDNFNWNVGIFFADYPDVLDRASKIDNWSQYFRAGTDLE